MLKTSIHLCYFSTDSSSSQGKEKEMDKVKGGTNCQTCIDCQRMLDIRDGSISWRCYGQNRIGELKRDICKGKIPPKTAPEWCPHR